MGAGKEYLPLQTQRDVLVEPLIAYDEQGNQIEGNRIDGKYVFETTDESMYYDVPLVYYKGYYAEDADGKVELSVSQVEKTGLVRVKIESAGYEKPTQIVVWYRGTVAQKISYGITAVSSILSVLVLICIGRKKKQRNEMYAKRRNE